MAETHQSIQLRETMLEDLVLVYQPGADRNAMAARLGISKRQLERYIALARKRGLLASTSRSIRSAWR